MEQVINDYWFNLRGFADLFLKEISINNFKSFYGEHILSLEKGLNVLYAGLGKGKTNLCKALVFALYGSLGLSPVERSCLVNSKKVDEASHEGGWIGCKTGLILMENQTRHKAERTFSLSENYSGEKLWCSNQFPKTIFDMFYGNTYVDEESSRYTGDIDNNSLEYLFHVIDQNIENGLGFMIMDSPFSGLPHDMRDELLNKLNHSGIEQTILLLDPNQKIPSSRVFREYSLGQDLESVNFKVHDFPFDPASLLRDLDVMIYDRYVAKGEIFHREVYGHEYTVETVDVSPKGGRYQRNISSIFVE